MNDSYVSKASEKNVFHDHHTPYILFYERIIERPNITEEKITDKNIIKTKNENSPLSLNNLNLRSNIPVQFVKKEIPLQPNSSENLIKFNQDSYNNNTKNSLNAKLNYHQNNLEEDSIRNQENNEVTNYPIIEQEPVNDLPKIINVKSEHTDIPKIISNVSSECDTQEESEENHSIKSSKTYPMINFKSAKLLKMKSILKWMKKIQTSRKFYFIELEDSSCNNTPISEYNNKITVNDSNPETRINNCNQLKESKIFNGNINKYEEYPYKEDNVKSKLNTAENKSNKQNNYNVTKHLRTLFGSTQIDTWDTEEDSDLLNQQIDFVKSSDTFKHKRVIKKDEYDVEYDTGKLKKVKKPKDNQSNYNVFQKYHNHMAYDKKHHNEY